MRHLAISGKTEAVIRRCSIKKVFLEIFQNSQENTCVRVSFLIKLQAEALAQAFSCEFCKISKNTFSDRTPPVAASKKRDLKTSKNVLKYRTVYGVFSQRLATMMKI